MAHVDCRDPALAEPTNNRSATGRLRLMTASRLVRRESARARDPSARARSRPSAAARRSTCERASKPRPLTPSSSSTSWASRSISARRSQSAALTSEKHVFGDRQIGNERELLVDDADARPADGSRVAEGSVASSSRTVPASGATAPPSILISVDLPAPFSPTSACTSPAPKLEVDVRQCTHARVRLRDAAGVQPCHCRGGAPAVRTPTSTDTIGGTCSPFR